MIAPLKAVLAYRHVGKQLRKIHVTFKSTVLILFKAIKTNFRRANMFLFITVQLYINN